jgi:hypothetical protein
VTASYNRRGKCDVVLTSLEASMRRSWMNAGLFLMA